MKLKCEVQLTRQFIEDAAFDVDEYIKRELAIKIVKGLPLSELEKIISYRRISYKDDPFLDATSPWHYNKILEMKMQHMETYYAEIETDENQP